MEIGRESFDFFVAEVFEVMNVVDASVTFPDDDAESERLSQIIFAAMNEK